MIHSYSKQDFQNFYETKNKTINIIKTSITTPPHTAVPHTKTHLLFPITGV
jgi:hypothetical protein